MSTFRDRTFHRRLDEMGDLAEGKFEDYMKKQRRGYDRFGLDRPPIAVYRLPLRLRYAPDYLTTRALVEVMGYGQDQTLKLKTEKFHALQWWNTVHPVDLFIYDSHKDRHTIVDLDEVTEWVNSAEVEFDRFREGKAYFGINSYLIFGE